MSYEDRDPCDACGHKYKQLDWGETYNGRDIWETWYKCPNCGYDPEMSESSKEKILRHFKSNFPETYDSKLEKMSEEEVLKVLKKEHRKSSRRR